MNACVDAEDSGSCQQYVGDHWPSMAKQCLFTDTQEWSLNNFTCLYFGSCQDNNIYWGCYEVGNLLIPASLIFIIRSNSNVLSKFTFIINRSQTL